jgi:cysteine desulfurase
MKKRNIYLDNASTTPVSKEVLSSMLPHFDTFFGNPSSLHRLGRLGREAVEMSRRDIANILGSKSDEIIFTSGGTESANLAILGIARANSGRGKHIIVSCIEHKAILDACHILESEGFTVSYIKVNKDGIISIEDLEDSLRKDTILVSIMYANNEIGTIQPISKISQIVKSYNQDIVFHSDACQAAGLLSMDTRKLGVDAMTISASKIYGPKGMGCLYLKNECKIIPIIVGGGQENRFRSGTENVPAIIGFAKALRIAQKNREKESKKMIVLRDYFINTIIKDIPNIYLNGSRKSRLPNNINISIKGVEGESLLLLLDEMGVYCSTGSACSSVDLMPSYVLLSIGLLPELAHCSIRITLGRHTKKSDIDYALRAFAKSIKRVRGISSLK